MKKLETMVLCVAVFLAGTLFAHVVRAPEAYAQSPSEYKVVQLASLLGGCCDRKFEVELNAMIVDCRDSKDLKLKFGVLVDLKEKYQKVTSEKKKK